MAASTHSQHVAGLQVESSDSPSKPEDYVVVNGYRLVSAPLDCTARRSRGPPATPSAAGGGRRQHASTPRQPAAPPPSQVKPYHFEFCCNMRQRWFGQNIIDIFTRVGGSSGSWWCAGQPLCCTLLFLLALLLQPLPEPRPVRNCRSSLPVTGSTTSRRWPMGGCGWRAARWAVKLGSRHAPLPWRPEVHGWHVPASRTDWVYVTYMHTMAGSLRCSQVTAETPLKDGQCIRHFIHRHEAPVPAGSIQVRPAAVP